jgi:hypothetical protein
MSDFKAYVVFADTHDYDCMSQWAVATYHDETLAKEHERQAQQIAWRMKDKSKTKLTKEQRELGKLLDPAMEPGTNYSVYETPLLMAVPKIEGVTI